MLFLSTPQTTRTRVNRFSEPSFLETDFSRPVRDAAAGVEDEFFNDIRQQATSHLRLYLTMINPIASASARGFDSPLRPKGFSRRTPPCDFLTEFVQVSSL